MTTFQEMFEKLAAEYPQTEPVKYTPTYYCAECRDAQVDERDDLCPRCVRELQQGYQVRMLAGRCANGSELDHGTRTHALKFHQFGAVCGAQPGRRSVGWVLPYKQEAVTCPKCLKKLGLS